MRLHRLRVSSFAGIGSADVAFGPGLNVLFGPNDLGKSTLVDAIRLALLLPHSSTVCEPYVPWSGGGDPVVELTFSTEAQRVWRVRKEFGKGGSSLLQTSRNGRDFEDVERARRVDAKLREILGWGLAEPGGTGASRGLPTSFLSTVLLSTQSEVTDVLGTSLQDDPTGAGKERIAAALQAVSQDPLFGTLLRETQERRDEAFTEKGAKKTAKGSIFKTAADRIREAREEKERLRKVVDDSDAVELTLRQLSNERARREEALARAASQLAAVEEIAKQAEARAAAAELARVASEEVRRIKTLGGDVLASEQKMAELVADKQRAESARDMARAAAAKAADALKVAEESARSAEADATRAETDARHGLELRKLGAERKASEAEKALSEATEAQKLVDASGKAQREHDDHAQAVIRAQASASELAGKLKEAQGKLERCELLERALALRVAEAQVAAKDVDVRSEAALQERLTALAGERDSLAARRAGITVPEASRLVPMRKLATELATARGALTVGLVVTVTPAAPPLPVTIALDGGAPSREVIAQSFEAEVNAEVDVTIADIATVRVRGGRRDAQQRASELESRWTREVAPALAMAGVEDLDALDAKVREARDLDTQVGATNAQLRELEVRQEVLAGAEQALRAAVALATEARVGLEPDVLVSLNAELDRLAGEPGAALRLRRGRASTDVEQAANVSSKAATTQALADQKAVALRGALDAAVAARDAAVARFPSGVTPAAEAARGAQQAASAELKEVTGELTSLQSTTDARARHLADSLRSASELAASTRQSVVAADARVTSALTAHASEEGRLLELRRQLSAEDLAATETAAQAASERLAALPVPERALAPGEVESTRQGVAGLRRELDEIEREVHRTQGALEQVGGAVAREGLRDAVEAFEQAERQERELEAEYEAWKLLLEQMKEADAAQASNLGQALAPAIANQFQTLTALRYQGLQLTPQLGTDGIVVGGAVRPSGRLSVGTREQLSTLYRICLGEYLQTAIVLDDQLVQSDGTRMDWFRALLGAKARSFQIVVFTCRPEDYLPASAMPSGELAHADSEGGVIRAVDLRRAVRPR